MYKNLWKCPEDVSFPELLETIFFYGYEKKKASLLSHRLAKLARSEKGLLYLDPETLASLPGVSNTRVKAMIAITELFRRQYTHDTIPKKEIELKKLAKNLKIKLEGKAQEHFFLFSFNRSLGLIQEHLLAKGGTESVGIYYRDILKVLLNDRAYETIIAHNHPEQSALPSQADMNSMQQLKGILREIGIELKDQLIVGNDGVFSCQKDQFVIF